MEEQEEEEQDWEEDASGVAIEENQVNPRPRDDSRPRRNNAGTTGGRTIQDLLLEEDNCDGMYTSSSEEDGSGD